MTNAMTIPTGQYGARHILDGAHRWLHAKTLNTATEQVLAPYWPGGCHGCRRCRRDENTTHN
jgi:hypothetical protein